MSKNIINNIIIVVIKNLKAAEIFNLSSKNPRQNIAKQLKKNNAKLSWFKNNTSFKSKFWLKKIKKE